MWLPNILYILTIEWFCQTCTHKKCQLISSDDTVVIHSDVTDHVNTNKDMLLLTQSVESISQNTSRHILQLTNSIKTLSENMQTMQNDIAQVKTISSPTSYASISKQNLALHRTNQPTTTTPSTCTSRLTSDSNTTPKKQEEYVATIRNISMQDKNSLSFTNIRTTLCSNFKNLKIVSSNISPAGNVFLNFFDNDSLYKC